MSAKLSLKIETKHDELDRISTAVEDLGGRENWPDELVYRVTLVIEELVLNIIEYGHDDISQDTGGHDTGSHQANSHDTGSHQANSHDTGSHQASSQDAGSHEIEITLTSEPDSLSIEIVDDGRPFDPFSDAPEPNLETSLPDRHVGGLGIHLVREMVDEMHYKRQRDRNHTTLVVCRTG